MKNDEETYALIGAAMEVHRRLGHGFLEVVYQQALAIELEVQGIPFERERKVNIVYRERILETTYRPDFLCFNSVVVELKALEKLSTSHYDVVLNYLKATGLQRALLINFGSPSLEHRRIVLNYSNS